MSYQRLLATLDKAENGPIIDEKDFDKNQIGSAVQDIIQRFDINWPKDVFVPSDDALADRLFEAGLTLAEESGLFCMDTRRRMVWERNELLDILRDASPEIKLGSGAEEVSSALNFQRVRWEREFDFNESFYISRYDRSLCQFIT